MSRVWRPRGDGSPPRHADVSVWLRGARRPHSLRDVPSGTQRLRNQADGTARAIRVGRPRLVGETTPSRKSQRSEHKLASCLRGSVAEPPTEESSRFSAGRMSTAAVAGSPSRKDMVSQLQLSLMYTVLVPVDENEERALRQAEYVSALPESDEAVEVYLLY